MAEGYRATESQTRYFASRSWRVLAIDLPGKERNLDRPLRIDPVSYPAVIDIAEIALKRPSTGEILWAATGSREFAALTVGGTACRLAHESYLRILSFGNDPQLFLPQSTVALGDSPLRLELSILVDPSPQAISTSLAEMQTERSQNEEHVRNIEQQKNVAQQELKQRDATIAANNAEIERERADNQSEMHQFAAKLQDSQTEMEASAARHEKERAEYQAQIHQFAAKLQDSQTEMEKIREHFVQTNQLLHAKSISLAESEARATELTARLRQKLHDLKKLTRLLGTLEDVAMRLRSSRRWKLANPMVSLRSKFLRGSGPAGYDHLDKVVAAYRRWRIAHPELDDLDEQIQRLYRQAALKDSTTELPTSAETLPSAEVSSASDRTSTVAPVAPKPIEFPVFDKVAVNSVQSERIQLAAKRSQTAELTGKLLKLDQNVKNFAEVFGLTRQGLQDSGSAAAIFVQSLFRDIREIRKRKFLWKACRLLRSMLSREETHDIPSNPKVTAEVLKQRLQGIQRTLKSKKTSPAMALSAMAELIALQNQVHRVLASLRGRSLLRLQQKTVTTGEPVSHLPASKFSPLFDTEWYLEKNPDVKKAGNGPTATLPPLRCSRGSRSSSPVRREMVSESETRVTEGWPYAVGALCLSWSSRRVFAPSRV